MDKRKVFGTILGSICFIAFIIAVSYAFYIWRSEETDVSINLSDSYFYCESGKTKTIELKALTSYYSGGENTYVDFAVNNIGGTDSSFSISMNITNASSELFSEQVQYQVVVDTTGGTIDCTTGNCTTISNGNFADFKIGMNTLAESVTIVNNSRNKYYVFLYLGNGNNSGLEGKELSFALDVCEIVAYLDYNGGNITEEFVKVIGDTYGETNPSIPTSVTKNANTIKYNTNGGNNVNDSIITHTFDGWYLDEGTWNSKIISTTTVNTTLNHVLNAKWTATSITPPTNITRTGYTFAGWYKDSGLTQSIGNTYTLPYNQIGGTTIDLYAKWNANQYTITLNNNGATKTGTNSVTATYDSSTINPSSITLPERKYTVSGFTTDDSRKSTGATISSTTTLTSNYKLNGWNTSSTGGNKVLSNTTTPTFSNVTDYTEDGKWKRTSNTTLYADWNSEAVTLPEIIKTGHTCGWTTNSNGTTIEHASKERLIPTENTILYAVCVVNKYTVTYDYATNGGTSATKTTAEVTYGTSVDLTPTATKANPYNFLGWNTDKNGNDKLESYYMPANDVTLYAIYSKEVTVTATFDKNGGNNDTSVTTTTTLYNKETSLKKNLTFTAPTCTTNTGWNCMGYDKNSSSTTTSISVGGNVIIAIEKTVDESDDSLTISSGYYHIWNKGVTVKFLKNGCSASDVTVSGTLYNNNENLAITTPAAPTMNTSWIFKGYGASSNAINGTAANTSMSVTVDKTDTEVIRYQTCSKSVSVTVTFDKNGGSTNTISTAVSKTLYNGATSLGDMTFTAPACTTNNAWNCSGYATSATQTTATWEVGATKSITVSGTVASSDTTYSVVSGYYHIWNKTVTVKFLKNGCSASDVTASGTLYNNNESLTITTPAVPTMNTSWTFKGYGSSSSVVSGTASGASMTITVAKTDTEVIRYQTCSKTVTVTATFDKNGGNDNTSTTATTTLYNGSTSLNTSLTFTAPTCTTKIGYNCLGYNTSSSSTTSSWDASSTKSILITGTVSSSDTTYSTSSGYYHIWKPNTYTVTFDVNDGEMWNSTTCSGNGINLNSSICSKTVTYNYTYGTLPIPTRTGYKFDGWYTAASNGTKIENTTTVTITTNQNLYAQWIEDTYNITLNANSCGTINSTNPFKVTNGTNANNSTSTSTKKVIIIGDRDGITGHVINEMMSSTNEANQRFEIVYSSTVAAVSTGSIDAETQQEIINLYEKYGREQIMVVIGQAEEQAAAVAETLTTGDPNNIGPLTGVTLNLDVWHIFELKNDSWVDTSIYDEQIGMMEMVLDVDKIISDVSAARTNNADVISSGILFTANNNTIVDGWYTAANGGSKVLDRNGLFTGTAVSGYSTTNTWNLSESKTLYAQCTIQQKVMVNFDTGNLVNLEDAHFGGGSTSGENIDISDGIIEIFTGNPISGVPGAANGLYTTISLELEAGASYCGNYSTDDGIFAFRDNSDIGYMLAPCDEQQDDVPTVETSGTYDLYYYNMTPSITITIENFEVKKMISPKEVTVGNTYGTLPTESIEGYNFDGWYTAKTGGTKITSTTTVTETTDHTLYAIYSKQLEATFYYYNNGIKTTSVDCTAYMPDTNCNVTVPLSTFNNTTSQYDGNYVGYGALNTIGTSNSSSLTLSDNVTYYISYRSNVTEYYAGTSRTIYRNTFFTNNSTMSTVLSTTDNGINNLITSSYTYDSINWSWYGYGVKFSDTSRSYSSVSSAATSTATSLYTLYSQNVVVTFYYNNSGVQTSITENGTQLANCVGDVVRNESVNVPNTVTSSTGINNTAYNGVSTMVNSTTTTTTVNTSQTNYYAVYSRSYTATFTKENNNVSTIGSTILSCSSTSITDGNTYKSTQCSIILPSITPSNGYLALGWYNSNNELIGETGDSLVLTNNQTYTAKARRLVAGQFEYDNTNSGINCDDIQCMIDYLSGAKINIKINNYISLMPQLSSFISNKIYTGIKIIDFSKINLIK